METVLVTGGAGFVGSHLVKSLLTQGKRVIALDNLYTGSKDNLVKHKNLQFIEHDVIEKIQIKVDSIFNLASPASPIHYQKDPIYTFKTNVLGALNMLELAKKNSARIFQASTSEIYGDPQFSPQTESYWGYVNTFGERACYDESKRSVETLFHDHFKKFNVDIRIARIFNTYGPFMAPNDGRVVSNFIVQALQNETLTLYGNGTQTRSFMYIDDLIKGILKLFYSESPDAHKPVNLGNPNEINMNSLAELIIHLTKSGSQIKYLVLPSDDPRQRKPDITLARIMLAWAPEVDLVQGLNKTIKYFERTIENEY